MSSSSLIGTKIRDFIVISKSFPDFFAHEMQRLLKIIGQAFRIAWLWANFRTTWDFRFDGAKIERWCCSTCVRTLACGCATAPKHTHRCGLASAPKYAHEYGRGFIVNRIKKKSKRITRKRRFYFERSKVTYYRYQQRGRNTCLEEWFVGQNWV